MCLGCQRCEMPETKMVTLHSGQNVCNDCPEWLLECEARHWIDIAKNRKSWQEKKLELIRKRGIESVNRLVTKMNELKNDR